MSIISSLCFVMIVAVYSIIADEPVCSQFSLFEKLLDKMIRIEHMIESTNEKMSKWEQIMEDNVKRLDAQKQSLNDDIEQKFNKVTSSLENFISKWNETLNNKLSDSNQKEEDRNNSLTQLSESLQQDQTKQTERLDMVIGDLQKQIGAMSLNISNHQVFMENSVLKVTEKQATPTVLFQAREVTDRPSSGQTLIFKTIQSNLHAGLHGGYSSNTGIFTAPVSGTYIFTVQACVYPGKYINGQIIAAGEVIAAMQYFEDGGGFYSCFSSSAVTTLSTGDTAYIKCTSASSGTGTVINDSGNSWWNMFSGVLIHPGTQ